MAGDAKTDAAVLGSVASPADDRWRDLFALSLWTQRAAPTEHDVERLVGFLYELNVVVPFDWPEWHAPDRYPGGRGLDSASAADAVRLITSYVRGDRFSDGALVTGLHDGSISAAVTRLWSWYRMAVTDGEEFVDRAEYSSDNVYRWSYERRWAPGGTLCWVGLNPGTGDRDSGPRPTLRKVVGWARREGCSAVTVVNLFSYRSTDPKALRRQDVDIVGERTDDTILSVAADAQVILVAWGGDKIVRRRSAGVINMLDEPVCVGVTKNGEPRHPLFVPTSTQFTPYQRTGAG